MRLRCGATAALVACASPVFAQHQDMPGMAMPAPPSPNSELQKPQQPPAQPPAAGSMNMAQGQEPVDVVFADTRDMQGALGPYSIRRESSGTAWQPDTSEHAALHVMSGD